VNHCPFYGLALHSHSGTTFVPTGGNQCGLMTAAHSPCIMELDGKVPDWLFCSRNPDPRAAETRERTAAKLEAL
jgi:hypothetical protein